MIVIYFFTVIATLFAGWRIGRRLRYFLHIYQLEGYKINEYRHWLGKRTGQVVIRLSHRIAVGVLAAALASYYLLSPFWTTVFVLPAWAITFASSRLYRSEQQKKPLKYTARLKRLLATSVFLMMIPVIAGVWSGFADGSLRGYFNYLLGLFVADFGGPIWVLLGAWLMQPVEKRVQEGFKNRARQTIAQRRDLTIIGITGSYGKTSVKFIIAEILKQRFNVLPSPASYNTPMGICLVINEKLQREHQVLVLEMGARYRGDIRELTEIARPDIGVVTSVGVAHLETMGPIENIALEKGSLIENLKPGGIGVLNADDPFVREMDSRAPGRVWRVSVEGNEADLNAADIHYDAEGAHFMVRDNRTGEEQAFRTRLLGRHNVLNILLGVAVGLELGLRLRQIAHATARVEPIEHRLQLRKDGIMTVIDDAFNSNPVGARNAVEILGQFTSGRRIIITPGMIELGERQYEENKIFGGHIARHVDLALLVGERQTRPIQEGILEAGFPPEQLKVFKSLFDAQEYLRAELQPGDVVLYENDLPDQYNE